MEDTTEKQWHYAKNGKTEGPVSESVIFDMIAAGDLGPADLVWNPECADWLPLGRSPFAKALEEKIAIAKSKSIVNFYLQAGHNSLEEMTKMMELNPISFKVNN